MEDDREFGPDTETIKRWLVKREQYIGDRALLAVGERHIAAPAERAGEDRAQPAGGRHRAGPEECAREDRTPRPAGGRHRAGPDVNAGLVEPGALTQCRIAVAAVDF